VASTATSSAGFSPRSTRRVKSLGMATMNCASPVSSSASASASLALCCVILK
jgi:hypothetical protein